jgi:hypothetical protein
VVDLQDGLPLEKLTENILASLRHVLGNYRRQNLAFSRHSPYIEFVVQHIAAQEYFPEIRKNWRQPEVFAS